MSLNRITNHPILTKNNESIIKFYWEKRTLYGLKNETISSALFANEIHIFGHHNKDDSPQGLFCANGQCSQCMVLVDGLAKKACMTKIKENMKVASLKKLPNTQKNVRLTKLKNYKKYKPTVLIIGGGPAGLSAAIELGKVNIETIIVDDKSCLGGKLVLQTHKFFGSVKDSYAGTRGFDIGSKLETQLKTFRSIKIWLNSTAVGVFSDGIVGILRDNKIYQEIKPEILLITTGAREKMLPFPGNTLPGVYGAGAFQTLVNRDLIKPSNKILIVGGGNVGLITGYHAIQAGIKVVGLVEALPRTGGYKVHSNKLLRMGVPIFTKHTVIAAHGNNHIEAVTIGELDEDWRVIKNTSKTFEIDTLLIAVGLTEVNEFYLKAKQWKMNVFTAGDAQEIAEASAAMFTGKIEGLKIANFLNLYKENIPKKWKDKVTILKSKPGKTIKCESKNEKNGVYPVFHCLQEIPCNPCTSICPENAIQTTGNKITGLPYLKKPNICKGCFACVAICPGLAITLVDFRKNSNKPTVTLAYEMGKDTLNKSDKVTITNIKGDSLGIYEIIKIIYNSKKYLGTLLVQIQVDSNIAQQVAGIQNQIKENSKLNIYDSKYLNDDSMICRCERINIKEVRTAIKNGVTDLNHMKALNRVGMGACGGKTCRPMILQILKEEKIETNKITDRVDRPLFVELSMGELAGMKGKSNEA